MNNKENTIEYISVVNTNYKVKNWLIYFLTLGRRGGYQPDKVPTLEGFVLLQQEVDRIKFIIDNNSEMFNNYKK